MLSFSSAGDSFPAQAGPKKAHRCDYGIVEHPAELARARSRKRDAGESRDRNRNRPAAPDRQLGKLRYDDAVGKK